MSIEDELNLIKSRQQLVDAILKSHPQTVNVLLQSIPVEFADTGEIIEASDGTPFGVVQYLIDREDVGDHELIDMAAVFIVDVNGGDGIETE